MSYSSCPSKHQATCQKPQGKFKRPSSKFKKPQGVCKWPQAGRQGLRASVKGFRASAHVITGASWSCTAKAGGQCWGLGWGSDGPHPGRRVCEAKPVPKWQWEAQPARDNSIPKFPTESQLLLWGPEWSTDATVCHTCWGFSIPRSQPSPQSYSRN